MNRFGPREHDRKESWRIVLLVTIYLVLLCVFESFGADLDLAYITKARLSKAVDAASLTAMRYRGETGETMARELGANAFKWNYQDLGDCFTSTNNCGWGVGFLQDKQLWLPAIAVLCVVFLIFLAPYSASGR